MLQLVEFERYLFDQMIPSDREALSVKSKLLQALRNLRRALSPANNEDNSMDWDHIEDNWKHFSATVKEKWNKLTEEEIADLKGKREHLEAKIHEIYGHAKDEVKKDVDAWLGALKKK